MVCFFLCLLGALQSSLAQELDANELKKALDRKYAYTSMRIALEQRDEAYKLKLRGMDERIEDIDQQISLLRDTIDILRSTERRIRNRQAQINQYKGKVDRLMAGKIITPWTAYNICPSWFPWTSLTMD